MTGPSAISGMDFRATLAHIGLSSCNYNPVIFLAPTICGCKAGGCVVRRAVRFAFSGCRTECTPFPLFCARPPVFSPLVMCFIVERANAILMISLLRENIILYTGVVRLFLFFARSHASQRTGNHYGRKNDDGAAVVRNVDRCRR